MDTMRRDTEIQEVKDKIAVAEEIQEVKDKIAAAEDQIAAAGDQIAAVEQQLAMDLEPEEKMHLRQEKMQLRQEKMQLLQEKMQLLQEKMQLRRKEEQLREVELVKLKAGTSGGQSSELELKFQNFWRSLDKAEMKQPTIQDANMEADEIPDEKATVKVLELKDDLPFMKGFSRIMVPEFYDELWKLAEPFSSQNVGVVITGTPGTGKSVMGWYFIYKLRMQRGLFNLVYQHERSGTQTFFSENGNVTQATTPSDKFKGLLDIEDTVYVVDGAGVLSKSARTFVFTSPNRRSYHEFLKGANKLFYSKVWSKSEILAARQLLFKDIDEHHVLELYRKWGGVPRHVLEKAKDKDWQFNLQSKAESVTGSQWLNFLTQLGLAGRADGFEVPDVVLHYRTEDYIQYEMVFASSYVSELAYSNLRRHNWVQTVDFLQTNNPLSASSRGILFERFAHDVLGRKRNVRVRSLEEHGHSNIETLEWPQLKRRTFQKLSFKGDLVEEPTGCYWEPESKNNAAFDAVCSNIGDDLGTFTALQMTISKNHGIQHDGLVKLLEAAPLVKRLYFVVPRTIFEEFQKQPFINKRRVSKSKDLNVRTRPPSDPVSGVEQWALEVEWDYAPPDHS